MRDVLIAYRDLTREILDLFVSGSNTIDIDRLDDLLTQRDSLIARHPNLGNLREDAQLLALAQEVERMDALARDLVAKAMQDTQALINQATMKNRRAAAYEQSYDQAYPPDAFFIDKKN